MLLLHETDREAAVETDHSYGFADDLGGGAYRRPTTQTAYDLRKGRWRKLHINSSKTFHARRRRRRAGAWRIDVSKYNLAISAADGERPCLIGDIEVRASKTGGTLVLDGLLIAGAVKITGAATVVLRHCTVLPRGGQSAVEMKSDAVAGRLLLERAIVGPIEIEGDDSHLLADYSIVQGVKGARGRGRRRGAPERLQHRWRGPVPGAACRGQPVSRPFVGGRHFTREGGSLLAARRSQDPGAPVLPFGRNNRQKRRRRVVAGAKVLQSAAGTAGYLYPTPGYRCGVDVGASDGQAIGAFHSLGEALRYENYADALAEHLPFQLRAVTTFVT